MNKRTHVCSAKGNGTKKYPNRRGVNAGHMLVADNRATPGPGLAPVDAASDTVAKGNESPMTPVNGTWNAVVGHRHRIWYGGGDSCGGSGERHRCGAAADERAETSVPRCHACPIFRRCR
jgi:hypothetical protein